MFKNRADAGALLADALNRYETQPCLVLAMPRGGVPVAIAVAHRLKAPLRLLMVRKIGLPNIPELAMGAVVAGRPEKIVRNDEIINRAAVPPDVFEQCCQDAIEELHRRSLVYPSCFKGEILKGKVAIIVDDGAATGATVKSAIQGLRSYRPDRIVVALPVASQDLVKALEAEADDVVCLKKPAIFHSVGAHYEDFRQLSDDDIITMMMG